MKKQILGVFILLLLVIVTPVAFADEPDEVGDVASVMNSSAPIPAGHFGIIAHYADIYLSNTNPGPARTISFASFLNKTFNAANFYVIDIRGVADYASNHVPGAVNVPFATVAKPDNLRSYPTNKPILVICYTGHTASMTSSILNTLGYNAWVLKGGMPSWDCSKLSCQK